MKIAMVASTHIPARRANTLQVMKMAQALANLGHEVRLVAPGPKPQAGEASWDSLARHYGLRHPFSVEWLHAHPRLRRYDYAYRAIRWAHRWGAGLIYTRLPQAAAIAGLSGLPTIFEIHDLPQGTLGPLIFRRFLHSRGARRLVVITQALAADLAGRFGSAIAPPFTVVAPDGVDLDRYENLPDAQTARRMILECETLPHNPQALQIRRFTAGYTGHLYAGRGVELLLSLAERLPEITFILAGGEPQDVSRLRLQAETKGLSNLILTGFVPNAELPRYQAACDVLLMPYQRRVAASSGGDIARYLSPMKVFEYLACGRPVLSSDLPVLREVLSPQNAILLPPDDIEAWVAALESLQTAPERPARLGQQARRDVAQYTWEARAARILAGLAIR